MYLNDGDTIADAFQLLIGLAEIHVPRMFVQVHPDDHEKQVS